ncbi:pappalysin-2 [Petaurus breviceps papuanus]|uniref:pappalysin-2 n=1 Tax=Petaurus breviceps papuanus TaxID=3040969 RepID=UPI0036D9DD54
MLGLTVLGMTVVVLTGGVFSVADSDLGWERKQSLVLRGRLNQVSAEGEPCWLGTRARRPHAAPLHHLFGAYPSRRVDYFHPYPIRDQKRPSVGNSKPGTEARLTNHFLQDEAQRQARSITTLLIGSQGQGIPVPQPGDNPSEQSDDIHFGSQGFLESLSESGTKERATVGIEAPSHPQGLEPESQRKGKVRVRHRRQTQEKNAENLGENPSWGGATFNSQERMPILYFSGRREQLLVRPEVMVEIPREAFTVEAWVRPEGGQNNPAIIAGVFDNCSHAVSDKGWALGIRSVGHHGRKDGRFFFSLRTDRVKKATIVTGHSRYLSGTWTHLVATYNGHRIALYVDGAQVASSLGQSGPLHSPFMASCRSLILGGDSSEDRHQFRGHMGTLTLWNTALQQSQLQQSFLQPSGYADLSSLALSANFAPMEQQWVTFKDGEFPRLEMLQDPDPEPEILYPLMPPPCGQTVCDNVELISQYNWHWPLRSEKVIRYQVVNICDDDGLHPTVSSEQITRQHQALSAAFSRYNISWQLSVHEVRNSTLRYRAVLVNCEPSKIGNDHCDTECEHPLTGYDGGDCRLQGRCYSWNRRDGVCHMECNNMLDDFDDGDCCDPDVTDVQKTCFDPDSPKRAYMSVKELKEALQLNSSHFLNVYFASSVREDLAGAATWPWDKEAISHLGGVVLNPTYYGMPGHTNIMIHEVGHVLGLYHVFKGVSERESCDDPCRETTPTMDTGDLCADTAPTPKSKLCQDPEPTNDTCGQNHFSGTPFNNYMSYTDDDCTDHFTPNQVARMHCYLDLVYQQWSESRRPSPIPVPPVVIGQTQDSLTIHWLPPISGVLYERDAGSLCGVCTEDGTFRQYVHSASSRRVCDSSGYWTPEEAVGPPDVDQPCEPSLQAWSPELHLYHMNMTVPCPAEGCSLELLFLHPVHADSLTLWITYLSTDSSQALFDMEVLMENHESIHLGPLDTFCDTPLTVKLNVEWKVSGVKVYTFDERMEIDAALLTSKPHSPLCSGCRPVKYQILRDPPFKSNSPVMVANRYRKFTDKEVTPGQVYQYQIQAAAGTELGEASPPLIHIHGTPYCGDGQVTESLGEECDDGDLLDGDGCSRKCKKEKGFNCVGEPSLCYIYEGDGICEPFEKMNSILDCGLYTPKGYLDQWAFQAYTSHQDNKMCPVSLVTGEPLSKVCKSHHPKIPEDRSLVGWFPCISSEGQRKQPELDLERDEKVWLKVCFDRPGVATTVFVFLASDGMVHGEKQRPTVTLHLSDVNGQNHSLGTYELSCQHNPLTINVTHNLNFLFHQTTSMMLNFSSPFVGISAVALRTSLNINPSAPNNCIPGHEGHGHQRPSCANQPYGEQGSCVPLLLDHADVVNCTSSSPGRMKCAVICERGFILQASSGQRLRPMQKEILVTCSSGLWDQSISCVPLDCGVPDQSHVYYASFSCLEGTAFLKRCSFSCISPAKLQGMNQWLTCLEDGLWSLPEAYCKLECDIPPVIPNANLLLPRCLQGNHDVGSICRYQCEPGYYVAESTDSKPRNKLLKIQCLESGNWEPGSCIPVVCQPPAPVFEGMYACTNGFKLGSQCVLNCNLAHQRMPIICTKEGLWTEEFKLCDNLQGECPPPTELNLVEYKCEQGYGIGAMCTPSCIIPPSDPVILPENITTDTMEHWMEPTKVQNIVCTGRLRWHPDPNLVYCIQSCEPFQADGWCDTINNRAYCQYDGGDCCSSTLSSKKVIPFAADCEQDECTCRDPKAEENQ